MTKKHFKLILVDEESGYSCTNIIRTAHEEPTPPIDFIRHGDFQLQHDVNENELIFTVFDKGELITIQQKFKTSELINVVKLFLQMQLELLKK